MADNISSVKVLLGIDDNLQDELLEEIERNTTDLFMAKTGAEEVPDKFAFMIREVMIKRYNRMGAEGMSQMSRTDLSQTFETGDFDEYADILKAEYDKTDVDKVRCGSVMFL